MTTDAAELARRLAAYLRGENSCGYAALHRYAEFVESMATRLETAERELEQERCAVNEWRALYIAMERERDEALSRLAEADAVIVHSHLKWGKLPDGLIDDLDKWDTEARVRHAAAKERT